MPEDPSLYIKMLTGAGCRPKVIKHCQAVCSVAMEYVHEGSPADRGLVMAGSILHDIGRSKTHSIGHAQAGAGICRELGLQEQVGRIVECHTGAGLTADECTLLGLLPIDCIPVTLEEKIVCNADNLVGGSHKFSIERNLMDAFALPRKVRIRIYRLWLEMELFRK